MKKKIISKKSKTDWVKIAKLKDSEIDTSDITELDSNFFKKAMLRIPLKVHRIFPLLVFLFLFQACNKGGGIALSAERAAPIGGEFLRFYKDSTVDYGYAVVKENMKAQGRYRYSHDTLYFLSDGFKEHFPEGFLMIKGDTLYMGNGLHFRVTKNLFKGK